MINTGSRRQVWNKTAKKTKGGLTRKHLFKKNGRIKSKRASRKAKKNQNLKNAGWTYKKGEFGSKRIEKKSKGRSKKGGAKQNKCLNNHPCPSGEATCTSCSGSCRVRE